MRYRSFPYPLYRREDRHISACLQAGRTRFRGAALAASRGRPRGSGQPLWDHAAVGPSDLLSVFVIRRPVSKLPVRRTRKQPAAMQPAVNQRVAERTRVNAHISPHIAKPIVSCQNHSNNWFYGFCAMIESFSLIAFLVETNRSFRIGAMKMTVYRTALFWRRSA